MTTARRLAFLVASASVALLATSVAAAPAQAATASSSVTVRAADVDTDSANAPFPGLVVTVSQTRDLQAQGIRISWTGAALSSAQNSQTGGTDFLQIAQCWGTDPTDATRPDRTTCQYGALATPGATRDSFRSPGTVATQDARFTALGTSSANPTYTSVPFVSATGVTIASVVDNKKVDVDPNTNQFFTALTTNEVTWVGSGADGTGSVQFELQTAAQSPGLGCGAPIATGNTVVGQSCWIVVIPRGTSDNGEPNITTSGLLWDSWKHSIGVKLDFKPLGLRCTIGAAERQLAGSELLAGAVASWQPSLCTTGGGSIFSMIAGSESDAAISANTTSTAPLALTSRPVSEGADGLQYAPVGLSAVTIAFSIDRFPSSGVSDDEAKKAHLAFTSMNLTPRLVAKLLTNSYLDSLPYFSNRTHLGYTSVSNAGKNARNLLFDPDFIASNPDWANQAIVSPSIADMLLPQGRSDAAWALWSYVISDPDAAAFLAGTPDPWGMVVNPWSSTAAAINKSGSALQLPRDNFPKADPVEQPASSTAGPINLVTWRPYVTDLEAGAYLTLRGDGQVLGGWDSGSRPPKYGKAGRSAPGSQALIALTDSAAASRYQVFQASLRNQAGQFIAPTAEAMTAAAAAMTPSKSQSQVLMFDPGSTAARTSTAAYPLTLPVYAAANPVKLDASLRSSYAAFIDYAVTNGQIAGEGQGQLPAGYAPIPDSWRVQAQLVAEAIRTGKVSTTKPTATAVSPPASSSNSGSVPPLSPSPAAPNPEPTGTLAAALTGNSTPDDPGTGLLVTAVPASVFAALIAAVVIPIMGRRRPRL